MPRYQQPECKRQWWAVLLTLIMVIILGLASRQYQQYLPEFIGQYAGDTLFGWMAFLLFALFIRRAGPWLPALCALALSYGIEFSQLYHAEWIDAIRATTLGGLVLGFDFLVSDLICYAVGILIGVLIDLIYRIFLKMRAESGVERVCRSKW